ncbi:unnamed protein product [Pedinophyceae sp. YPF-701]|nr:unnamed protein product [Pedinophyceae sp. YPF-701]
MLHLAYYIVMFACHLGLIGMNMWALFQARRLQQDRINPHDFASKLNALVVPEHMFQLATTIMLWAKGHYLLAIPACFVTWTHVRQHMRGDAWLSPTDAFTRTKPIQAGRGIKQLLYVWSMVAVLYLLAEDGVKDLVGWMHGYREKVPYRFSPDFQHL